MKITPLSLGAMLLATPPLSAIDTDGDGMCDVWEARYHAGALLPDVDTDEDGFDNASESRAGTDPFDPKSKHEAATGVLTSTHLGILVASQIGKSYQLTASPDLLGDYQPVGAAVVGNGAQLTLDGPRDGERRFYRVVVTDTDSDGDGISDWAENQLAGFDPNNSDSFGSGTPNHDLTAGQEIMQALLGGEVSASVETQDAYELEETPAAITVSRSGSTNYPMTVFLRHHGSQDVTKASAADNDFSLQDDGGGTPTISLSIPAGNSTATLLVQPNPDLLNEVPEQVLFDISFVADDLLTRICDATNIPDNERLFYAAFVPETSSPASGYSIIRLQGDNDTGLVSSYFHGLTSVQTAAHIHIKNPFTGPHIESLPSGQLIDHPWQLRAAQFLTTDQAVLDALFNGGLYSNVHSMQQPSGEIRADYLLSTGTTSFTPPPAPPAINTLTGDALDRDIARFLTQTTFGPTPESMEALRTLVNSAPHNGDRISAFSAWLDEQLDETLTPKASLLNYCHAEDGQMRALFADPESPYYDEGFTISEHSRRHGWWTIALFSNDQVRHRIGQALIEIFVTSDSDAVVDARHLGHSQYYDMLVSGIDGSYRELIEGISVHPIMGQYLSHLRNQKEQTDEGGNVLISPDENYAREIMQLFSIGLVELHPDGSLKLSSSGQPIPTYNQNDITELARVFTGWSFSVRNSPSTSTTVIPNYVFALNDGNRNGGQAQWTTPMASFSSYHDFGEKVVLGTTLPADVSAESELDAFLDHLNAHPNVAPFMARRLIQRLVTSNPSTGYVHRITQVWHSSNGHIGEVCKAILLDYEARSLEIADRFGSGKKKEPLIHYTGIARALQSDTEVKLSDLATWDTTPSLFDAFPANAGRFREGDTDESIGQTPFESPSVFNWFLPDYSTGDAIADVGMVSPELQIATESSVITNINRIWSLTNNTSGEGGRSLPDQADRGYSSTADHLIPDITLGPGATQIREQIYMAVMDENGDGVISDGVENLDNPDDPDNGGATVTAQGTGDPTHFDNPEKIREACAALVDHLDLLLCAGSLKAEYGQATDPENPRDIIIDYLAANSSFRDNDHNTESQERVRHERYEKAAYIIATSPYSMIQR